MSSGNVRGPGLVVLLVLVATVPAYTLVGLGWVIGGVLAVLIALGIGLLARRSSLPLLALATLPAAVLVGSHLVPSPTRYIPIFVIGLALALAFLRAVRAREVGVTTPPRPVIIAVAAYFGWAAVTTPFSTSLLTSVLYLAGMVGTLGLAFVVIPSVLAGRHGRRQVAAAAGLIGGVLAIVGIVLAATGPVSLFGQHLGLDVLTEVSLGNIRTGLILPRTTGIFDAPAEQALALAVGLVSIVALRPERLAWGVLSLVVGLGLMLTLARDGWLAVAGGVLAVLAGTPRARRDTWVALAWAVLFVGLLGAVTVQLITVAARPDLARDRYGENAALLPEQAEGSDTVRGGTSLSGRIPIWVASLDAIAERPLVGWGLGQDPDAIAPHLVGADARFRGLTSHNTWLRTAVEIGLPGLAAFFAILVASAWAFSQAVRRGRQRASLEYPGAGPAAADRGLLALVGIIVALFMAQGFETLLLGGLNFPSFIWTVALGMVAGGARGSETSAGGTAEAARS
ncbi:MAG TPA: O-antigen ligase family protein [Candidatus Eisenbacteria bacterium]|nr:O-antigen ligase family protein [Candidatus Eisenbacteria bacterium]